MRLLLALLSAMLLPIAACSGDDDASDDRLQVVATTTQIGDFARQIGGDQIKLNVLLKPNQDAHDFELSPSQVRAIAGADVVLMNGIGIDAFVEKALETSHAKVAIVVTDGISTIAGHHEVEEDEDHAGAEEEDEHGDEDPHVWFDVANARTMVGNIRDALTEADAANATAYRQNAARYVADLEALDASIRQQVAQVPSACRKLVTNHDVLSYFAAAYGFEVVGAVIPSTSSQASASAADVAGVVRQIEAEGVPAIFAERSINPDLIRQVGREAGVKVVDDLYGDSLGSSSEGDTYIKMMQSNTKKIVEALKECPS
jgi:ABC-type Zn uptake system ZnuABC Zn-binding protein ZnuA